MFGVQSNRRFLKSHNVMAKRERRVKKCSPMHNPCGQREKCHSPNWRSTRDESSAPRWLPRFLIAAPAGYDRFRPGAGERSCSERPHWIVDTARSLEIDPGSSARNSGSGTCGHPVRARNAAAPGSHAALAFNIVFFRSRWPPQWEHALSPVCRAEILTPPPLICISVIS